MTEVITYPHTRMVIYLYHKLCKWPVFHVPIESVCNVSKFRFLEVNVRFVGYVCDSAFDQRPIFLRCNHSQVELLTLLQLGNVQPAESFLCTVYDRPRTNYLLIVIVWWYLNSFESSRMEIVFTWLCFRVDRLPKTH